VKEVRSSVTGPESKNFVKRGGRGTDKPFNHHSEHVTLAEEEIWGEEGKEPAGKDDDHICLNKITQERRKRLFVWEEFFLTGKRIGKGQAKI